MTKAELEEILVRTKKLWESMTPEQQEEMLRAQRDSWVRGEMGIGSDADERRWKEEHGF